MRLADWLAHQQAQHPNAIELGLERVREVANRLGLLPWSIPSVIVGGTNGKGSTVAYLTALAAKLKLRVGIYTSPHLQRYNERIAIDAEPIDDEALEQAFERIEAARGDIPLTFFEYGTLAAYEIFKRTAVDVAIVEVGLGGRLDATNVIDADVAVLTSIGLDHTDWLGPTLEHIGAEKAGIFRRGRPVVLGHSEMPQSVHRALDELACHAIWPATDLARIPQPRVSGPIQRANAAAAVAAFEALIARRPELQIGLPLAGSVIEAALRDVRLRGRCQRIEPASATEPEWVLDVAHNPHAAMQLAAALRELPPVRRCIAVVGILDDKDAVGIHDALADEIDGWVLVGLEGPRGGDVEALRARWPATDNVLAMAPDVAEGCALARALSGPGERIVVLGSFHVVGPALDWLGV